MKPSRKMFIHHIWRGLAAPILLFETPRLKPPATLEPIRVPQRSDSDALRSDWNKIGADMWRVIRREQTQHPSDNP